MDVTTTGTTEIVAAGTAAATGITGTVGTDAAGTAAEHGTTGIAVAVMAARTGISVTARQTLRQR